MITRTRPPAKRLPDISSALVFARRLVATARQFVLSLDIGTPPFIELPPDASGPDDQARLQSAATLYLAADLEAAGLLPAAETIAELAVTGGLQSDLGSAQNALVAFWRDRHNRFTPQERSAFYAHLFGQTDGPSLSSENGSNDQFETVMIDLADALGQAGNGPAAAVTIRTATRSLMNNLLPRSGGLALTAAADLLTSVQQALELLKHPDVQRAVGARGIWDVVQYVTRRLHGGSTDVESHLNRGKSGMTILAWLANSLPTVGSVTPGDPVVDAAVEWLQASLALHQAAPSSRRGGA